MCRIVNLRGQGPCTVALGHLLGAVFSLRLLARLPLPLHAGMLVQPVACRCNVLCIDA